MTATLDDLLNAMSELIKLVKKEYEAAQDDFQIEVLTVANTAASLYAGQKIVRKAVFQNLSTSDSITLARGQSGKPASVTAGAGIILNPATASSLGGGSITFLNVDLSQVTAISQTNNSQSLAVVYFF